ncbi:MAG: hypothetical protein EOP46_16315 [Sphingobacteriaceae bacterium]|nr:MAG: hypothetical protein EOP46_16315 [Sphingobacteriaceae bacterium]
MKRLKLLVFHFYKPVIFMNLLFTFGGLYQGVVFGIAALPIAIVIKLFGYFVTVSYQYFFDQKIYFYYRNAGYSARQMYTYTFALDFLIFIILSIPSHLIHYAITNIKG